MRRFETGYFLMIVVLMIGHLILGLPIFFDASDVLQSDYGLIMWGFPISSVIFLFVREIGYIRKYYTTFHIVSFIAFILSFVPVVSAIPHLIALFVGGSSLVEQYERIQELYGGLDRKQAREDVLRRYGSEDLTKTDDDKYKTEEEKVREFIKRDKEQYAEDYEGFLERAEETASKELMKSKGRVIVEDGAYSTDEEIRESIELAILVRGEEVKNELTLEELMKLNEEDEE